MSQEQNKLGKMHGKETERNLNARNACFFIGAFCALSPMTADCSQQLCCCEQVAMANCGSDEQIAGVNLVE